MNLIELYKALLSAAGMITTEDGCISGKFGDTVLPATLRNKRLVLPIKQQLETPDWSGREIFSPLSENPMLPSESPVVSFYRKTMNTRLNVIIGDLISQLLTVGASVGTHSKLNPDQSDVLRHMSNADEKMVNNFSSILKNIKGDSPEQCIINIYLKKSGLYKGEKMSRVAIVTFPLYKALKEVTKDNRQVFGVNLRAMDVATYIKLFEYIFPNIEDKEEYNYGTNKTTAVYMDALMHSVKKVGTKLNEVIGLFSDILDNADELTINGDWVAAIDNLDNFQLELSKLPMPGSANSLPVQTVQPEQTVTAVNQQSTQSSAMKILSSGIPQFPGNHQQVQQQNQMPSKNAPGTTSFLSLASNNPTIAASINNTLMGMNHNNMSMQESVTSRLLRAAAQAPISNQQYSNLQYGTNTGMMPMSNMFGI